MLVKKVSSGSHLMKRLLLCLLVTLNIGGSLNAASSDNVLWSKANQLYAQKEYDSALTSYEELLKTNNSNALLHYNTGNAYYRINKMGMAILHFEKAAHLDPANKTIQDNLLLTKAKVQDNMTESSPIFFVTWWNALNHAVSANVWASIALLFFLAVLAIIYFSRTKKSGFPNAGRWASLAIVCLLMTGSMAWISFDEYTHSDKAVVISSAAVFLQSPQANSKAIGSLPEGLVIEVVAQKGDYYKVTLQNGKSGWIAANEIGIV